MEHDRTERPANEPSVIEQAAPRPAPPTDKERQQIADAQAKAKKDREELRAAGFGDHKGTEGF
jgi:hypothetical protein